jgi:hypothetical protein
MKSNTLPAALIIMVLLSACAPRTAPLAEVAVAPARLSMEGYSLLPPNEDDWFVVGRNEQQVSLAKKGGSPGETRMIQAMLLQLPDFSSADELAAWVKEGQAKNTEALNFTIKEHDVSGTTFNGAQCALSAMKAGDRHPNEGDAQGPGIMDVLTMTCSHPLDKNVGVYVLYSFRHAPGHEDRFLAIKAGELFQSVEFSKP